MVFDWKNEVILISGASSGLGRALALRASELKATLVLIARNKQNLDEVNREANRKGGNSFCFSFDLENLEQIPYLYNEINQAVKKKITILINNVGYQAAGFIQNTPIQIYERSLRINTLAPIVLIQCVLPDMLRQQKGVIANVMSSIMYRAFPGVSAYCASKFALRAIHESLKSELSGTAIRTLYIRPGSLRSNYWRNTDVGGRISGFRQTYGPEAKDPAYAADRICKAIESKRESFEVNTIKDKVCIHLTYWAPKVLEKAIIHANRDLLAKRPKISN